MPIVGINDYLNHSVTVNVLELNGSRGTDTVTAREMGFDTMWDEIIKYTEAHPVYTTTLAGAQSVGLHEKKRKTVDESVFNYIYAEGDEDTEGEPKSPLQFANWYALGQLTPSSNATGNAAKGATLYKEAKAYAEFREKTKGKMEKEFIDVLDKNNKPIPVEVSSDKEGNTIVGPFALKSLVFE